MQAAYSELAQESLLHWPAVSSSMAPDLFSLYKTAMISRQELAQQRLEARATDHPSRSDATQEATAAAAAADEMAAAEAAEPETALDTGDAVDFGGAVDMEGVQEERMNAPLHSAQPAFSDQGFVTGDKNAAAGLT